MQARTWIKTAAAIAAVALCGSAAASDNYPSKPVRIIVGFQAGGPTDVVARLVAKALQDELKSAFVVENKVGATSNIASEMVAAAKPDGYTLLLAAAPLTMNKFVFPKQKFDPLASFEPVSKVSSAPGVLAASPKLNVRSYKEFEELVKKKPGELSYGTTGAGGTQHMATLRLEQLTGMRMLHVPYSGSSGVLNDLIAGVVDVAFMTSTGAMPNLEAGRVRPLAVAGPVRLPGLPSVPTFAEIGMPGMVSDSWNGLLAPAGTPKPIVDRLAAVVVKAVKSKEFQDTLIPQGAVLIGNSPAEFKAELQTEVVHWAEQFKKIRIEK
ncbi:Bug family tripartite tricarboxylate transporter substrate binding protein [Comamonas endophytica]|uniref:Tripartite tricarboxylate transporter substrate binding protein n=1 Tax=Comamonas endophytica TaxID=2949090 RepID=A0ABY6GE80_9BURK|nr:MULTISPECIES: tripartite tricarboxylate transporter substrate binding protein [unclassified Acidovorax]MCD2513244.1 tripartite tricarboxylate transporter substrate binding protein [Acidovorax sp. D4N7]UYG53412.1 tripartite tricarboxylate transporter substrate binding protein [Acidovorax sp. 5MLIR]